MSTSPSTQTRNVQPNKRPLKQTPGTSSPFGSRQDAFIFDAGGFESSPRGSSNNNNNNNNSNNNTNNHNYSRNYVNTRPNHGRSQSQYSAIPQSSRASSTNWTTLIPPMPAFPPPVAQSGHSQQNYNSNNPFNPLNVNASNHPNQRHSIAISPSQDHGMNGSVGNLGANVNDLNLTPITPPSSEQKFPQNQKLHQYYQQQLQQHQKQQQQQQQLPPHQQQQQQQPFTHTPLPLSIPPQFPPHKSQQVITTRGHSNSNSVSLLPRDDSQLDSNNKNISNNNSVGEGGNVNKKSRKRKKVCVNCGLEITGQFVRALSNAYHVECFTCNGCGKQCSSKFFPHEETDPTTGVKKQYALCEYDYFKKLDLICFNCDSALRGPYITALGNKYHLEHFKCAVCQKVFESDESYYEHESNIYCHYHYSKLYASHCEGCHSSIVKQFVELFRGGRNQHWHPECYMVHKFWNVCITADSVGLQDQLSIPQNQTLNMKNLKDLDNISSELLLAAEQQIETTVMTCWLTLSGYEEVTASCISDMLLHACTCNQVSGLISTGKLILNLEILFKSLDAVKIFCSNITSPVLIDNRTPNLKTSSTYSSGGVNGSSSSFGEESNEYFQALRKEPRNISGKIMSYLAILRKSKQISTSGSLSAELLSVITGCAHYLKLLIRIGLNNALKANKLQGTTEAIELFLSNVSEFEKIVPRDGTISTVETANELIEERLTVSSNATDACHNCQKSIEKECVKYQNKRWHPKCFVCSHCTQTISIKDEKLKHSGFNSLGGLVSCYECISKDSDSKTGYEYVSDLSQLIYLLKIALARSKSVMIQQQQQQIETPTPKTLNANAGQTQKAITPNMTTINEHQRTATEEDYSKTIDDVTRLRSKRQSQKLSTSIKQKARKSVIVDAPEAASAKKEEEELDHSYDSTSSGGLDTRNRNTSVSSQLSFTQNTKESDLFNVSEKKLSLKIRDEPQRQLTNSHLDRTSDLLKNEKSLTLDDIPRIVAAEQAREQRPNAFKHHNSLYQSQKPLKPVKTIAAASGRSGKLRSPSGAFDSPNGYAGRSPSIGGGATEFSDVPSKYFSELTKSEHFILRHIAVEALIQILNNKYNKEELLGLIQTRKQPTFWNKFKFGGANNDKKSTSSGVFGVDLQELTQKYGVESDHGVGPSKLRIPIVVDDIINALRQKDMSVEGIFRLNGNIKKLRELTEVINKNPFKSPDFSMQTAVQLAALMKKWLRELPNPLLTFNLYDLWISSQKESDPLIQKKIIHLAYSMLPRSHRNLLEVLLYFFSWVASFAEIDEATGSKMDIHNLATVIAPNILYSKASVNENNGGSTAPTQGGDTYFLAIEVVNQLIEMHEELSTIPDDLLEFFESNNFNTLPEDVSTKEIMHRLEKISQNSPPFFVLSFKELSAQSNDDYYNNSEVLQKNTVSRGHSKHILESHGETTNV